jgi:aspartyl-tRNA(Asn)/glutamyl-tRNA(Gln) amidotransferase subunit C
MKIDNETIDRLAHLARLEYDGEAKEAIKKDLERVLDMCEKLNELDTEGIEPLIFMSENVNDLREDEVKDEISRAEALKNAPDKDSDYFRVPKVINR